jgi:hypothetical protein
MGSIFCSIYQADKEEPLEYNDLLNPDGTYFALIREGDKNEKASYGVSYANYLSTLNCNSVRINLFNSDKLTNKIECLSAPKDAWGFKIKTSNNITIDIWTAPHNNNKMTVYTRRKEVTMDNSSCISYDNNFKIDPIINAILEYFPT